MILMDMTVKDFAAELASDSPAPGGGTIAATSGAFAAGLGAMVCRLTIGNEKYPEAQPVLPAVLTQLDACRANFIRLADQDTEAFNMVMAAFKLPKATDEEKAARKAAIAAANLEATLVPLETARNAVKVAECLVPVMRLGNSNSASDVGVGIESARLALQGAAMNVGINLPSVKDAEQAASIGQEIAELKAQSALFYEQGVAALREKLNY